MQNKNNIFTTAESTVWQFLNWGKIVPRWRGFAHFAKPTRVRCGSGSCLLPRCNAASLLETETGEPRGHTASLLWVMFTEWKTILFSPEKGVWNMFSERRLLFFSVLLGKYNSFGENSSSRWEKFPWFKVRYTISKNGRAHCCWTSFKIG